jgi:2-phospho-L-lactate guanylyltransferase
MNFALIPIKRLSAGKSRLVPQLERPQVEALTLAMLEDILEAFADTPDIERSAVITPDPEVAACARSAGATALLRPDPGLNEAIDEASAALELTGDDSLLVVLGDVAGARSRDFAALYEAASELGERCAVLAPSGDGGSAALLRRPYDVLPTGFGGASAKTHREAAARRQVAWRELTLPGLAIDLDRADDVMDFLASDSGGPRTRALLRELGWSPNA